MNSLPISFAPPTVRVYATKGSAGAGSVKEEKGPFDWVFGYLTKQDQFYETDPILQKPEDKPTSGTGTGSASGRKSTVAVPQKKKNGGAGGVFGGLFAKK
ncbi:hypothetical protein M5689_010897 [Euphorbia peplus]|nr:hypothetical protein M5689_010897 [Euphorbia peplus]